MGEALTIYEEGAQTIEAIIEVLQKENLQELLENTPREDAILELQQVVIR